MKNKILFLTVVTILLLGAAVPAFAGGPNFGEIIYADDATWGTKATTSLPAPNDHNRQSFDGLFTFSDDAAQGQLAVAEAAPGNRTYNGGRWIVYEVTWVGDPVLVTSYAQLHTLMMDGEVTIDEAGAYFQCPLLPVK